MPATLTELPRLVDPPRKRWTRAEYQALPEGNEHLELIDGELITTMGKKRPHVNALTFLHFWLLTTFGVEHVNVEAPIDVSPEDNPTNEPVPDLIVLGPPTSAFAASNPRPEDVILVAEVSDTTLGFDLTTKARLYARAGIAEYWVLDIAGRRLIVHRNPAGGAYGSVEAYAETEFASPLAAPHAQLRVSEVISQQ